MATHRASPRRATKQPEGPRTFSLVQATASLPYVKRVVGDIVRVHGAAQSVQSAMQALPPGDARKLKQNEFEGHVDRLQELNDELRLVGAELKDYASGLVDFPARHKGHRVYLCWKLGDDTITHFHEVDAGYAGRQPVETLVEG